MTPENAVDCLVKIVVSRQEFTEDDIYSALALAGVPDRLADRAYKFTQIAWGRVFLAGLGVSFSSDYMWLDARGEIVESGKLQDEPCFVTAMQLSEQCAALPGFTCLAVMSADVAAVNNGLHNGVKTENMIMAPSLLFAEAPTQAGMEKAERLSASLLEQYSKQHKPEPQESQDKRKPWWRFWN